MEKTLEGDLDASSSTAEDTSSTIRVLAMLGPAMRQD